MIFSDAFFCSCHSELRLHLTIGGCVLAPSSPSRSSSESAFATNASPKRKGHGSGGMSARSNGGVLMSAKVDVKKNTNIWRSKGLL